MWYFQLQLTQASKVPGWVPAEKYYMSDNDTLL